MEEHWTWTKFKTAVEEASVKGMDQIAWIDWSSPADSVEVHHRPDGALQVTAGHRGEGMADGE